MASKVAAGAAGKFDKRSSCRCAPGQRVRGVVQFCAAERARLSRQSSDPTRPEARLGRGLGAAEAAGRGSRRRTGFRASRRCAHAGLSAAPIRLQVGVRAL